LAFGPNQEGVDAVCDPLPIGIGTGIGSPKGHARVTQASRKGDPMVDSWKSFVCNQSRKMTGRGEEIVGIAVIADIGEQKPCHG